MTDAVKNAAEDQGPVFMFGFERSGTTLLSMMVGAHPQIAVPFSVTGMWYRYARDLAAYEGLTSKEGLERLVDDLLNEPRTRLWDIELDRATVLAGLEPGSFAAVVARFHQLYARAKGKPLWANIDIATLEDMDIANRLFPAARFLHIVRDGRDVALSHETYRYGGANTLECAEFWVQKLQTNLKMGAMLEPSRYQLVRYEDLVLDSEATLRAICRFIGVDYSPAMLHYPAMVADKVPEETRRTLWPALDKPPDASKVYGWKKRMSTTKRVVFEGVAKQLLKDLGYEAYDQVPKNLLGQLYGVFCFASQGGRVRRFAARLRPSRS